MKTTKQRSDERRQEKLKQVQRQIDEGTLTIRKMTAKERKAHPPRPRPESGRGSGRRR
jgi:hypothetical protein